MDCEKFESTLIDELYDELDELTSAAHKRHVAGCARCASLLSGLKATRRVAVLPILEPPAGLEEKILAAARDAQKVVPIRARVSRVVSLAGSWAMRPQTAMAAVFLLLIGSSLLLLKPRSAKMASTDSASEMVVTGEGSPTATPSAAAPGAVADESLDTRTAAAAHGAPSLKPAAPMATAAASALALNGPDNDLEKKDESPMNAMPPAGAPRGTPEQQVQGSNAYGPGPSGGAAPAVGGAGGGAGGDWGSAMAAYNAHNFTAATRSFDALAAQGDENAALWAARSVREGNGCASAAGRFDKVMAQAYGTTPGYDATLEGGRCYRLMGSFDLAQARFVRLLTVPAYAQRAQTEISAMQPAQQQAQAQRMQAQKRAAAPAPPAAAAAPPPVKAAPPATATPKATIDQSAPTGF